MPEKHKEFKKRIEQLHGVILDGLLFYTVWGNLRLHNEKETPWSLDQQNQVLGRWAGFFTPVGIGLQRAALIEFAKVFDRDSRTASLTNLLADAKKDGSLIPNAQPGDLQEISRRLRAAEATRRTIKTLRDQRLAHADATPESLPPLLSQQFDSLIEDIKFAFNRLSVAHDSGIYHWGTALDRSERETGEVLRLLLAELQRSQAEYDDQMVQIIDGQIRRMETTLGRLLDENEMESILRQYGATSAQEARIRDARS